jgi:outer membrane protein
MKIICDNYSGTKSYLLSAMVLLAILIGSTTIVSAQALSGNSYKLTLTEAVQFAKIQNKWVQAAGIEENASDEDRNDAYHNALPTVNVSGSYQRFSDLTLFTVGLSHATTGRRKPTPNSAALGIDALFNIYSGGRQRALQNEQTSRLNLAKINTRELAGNIGLQTANGYLDLVKLNDLEKLIVDQQKRAVTRLNNINSLYKNQKVTRSDVLRAAVALANVRLSLQQNENDMTIANARLNVLLNVPDSVKLLPTDTAGMPKPEVSALLPMIEAGAVSSYAVQKAAQNSAVQRARLKGVESNNLPGVSFYAAYGVNYPNYLFFPPVNQAYAIGFVGLKAQYSISSLYHNKSKVAAGRLRVKELELQQEAYADNVRIAISSDYIKYAEALSRISVNEHSLAQAMVNYRIVNTKYLNQLSLLTDLLEADNLYQESRFNLIRAQTDALGIYYHIRYTSGNL